MMVDEKVSERHSFISVLACGSVFLQYKLESFCEARSTQWAYEPYRGELSFTCGSNTELHNVSVYNGVSQK